MKLSEVKPCAVCHGPLLKPMGTWYVVRVTQAMINPRSANQVMGMAQFFQGNLALAELFAPADEAILIMGDKEPALMTELHICFDCMHGKLIELPIAIEGVNARG
jgi:hypothetical protein